jgi:hypothetical protein
MKGSDNGVCDEWWFEWQPVMVEVFGLLVLFVAM